jgi:hypothetical protein
LAQVLVIFVNLERAEATGTTVSSSATEVAPPAQATAVVSATSAYKAGKRSGAGSNTTGAAKNNNAKKTGGGNGQAQSGATRLDGHHNTGERAGWSPRDVVCWNCDKVGHFQDQCRQPKKANKGGANCGFVKVRVVNNNHIIAASEWTVVARSNKTAPKGKARPPPLLTTVRMCGGDGQDGEEEEEAEVVACFKASARSRHHKKHATVMSTVVVREGYMKLVSELERLDINTTFLGTEHSLEVILQNVLPDTGSQVNILPIAVAEAIEAQGTKLERDKSGLEILGAGHGRVPASPVVYAEMKHKGRKAKLPFLVADIERPILSRDACHVLQVFSMVAEEGGGKTPHLDTEEKIRHHFRDLFDDNEQPLRPMKCAPMNIKLKPGVTPAPHPRPRPIPMAQMETVKAKLDAMVRREVARKLEDETSEWMSALHFVTKKNGDIWVVNDMRELNNQASLSYDYRQRSPGWHRARVYPLLCAGHVFRILADSTRRGE